MSCIRTAISLRESVFNDANRLARKMHLSRSKLFEIAVQKLLQREENLKLFQQLNTAYAGDLTPEEKKQLRLAGVQYRKLVEGEW